MGSKSQSASATDPIDKLNIIHEGFSRREATDCLYYSHEGFWRRVFGFSLEPEISENKREVGLKVSGIGNEEYDDHDKITIWIEDNVITAMENALKELGFNLVHVSDSDSDHSS